MVIDIDWGSAEETFIVWRIAGEWALHDFQIAHFISCKMMETKTCTIDVLMDIRTAAPQVHFASAMIQLHRKNRPSNAGKIILIQSSEIWQRSLQLVENFHPDFTKQFIFTFSVDEAYAYVLQAA